MFGVQASACPRTLGCLLLLAAAAALPGCYERKESAVINPDGSGRMLIETTVAVPSQGLPGEEKPTPLTFGRQVAADFINTTLGVDAWADLQITELEGGRAHISVVAYFDDLNELRFDMPLVFLWTPDAGGGGATFAIERVRKPVKASATLSDADLKDMVEQAQKQYKVSQLALQTQLNAFTLEMKFELPGEVSQANLLTKEDATVSITLDGKKAMKALDEFMADNAALAATFKAGQDLPTNDDILLRSMYGANGPVSAHVKFIPLRASTEPGTEPGTRPATEPGTRPLTRPAPSTTTIAPRPSVRPPTPAFDYRTELKVAQIRQPEMLKQAGVDLIPKFIVNETRPSTKPATAPGRGG